MATVINQQQHHINWPLSSSINKHQHQINSINHNQHQKHQNHSNNSLQQKIRGKLWEEALKDPVRFTEGVTISTAGDVDLIPINCQTRQDKTKPSLSDSERTRANVNPDSRVKPQNLDERHSNLKNTSKRDDLHEKDQSDLQNRCKGPSLNPLAKKTNLRSVVTFWSRPQKIGPGFINTGNTCFINAVLQALVHTPALNIGLLDMDEHSPHSCQLTVRRTFCALCRMYNLLHLCFRKANPSNSIRPSPISQSLPKFAPSLRPGQQGDAHEFLRMLVNAMQLGALGVQGEKCKQEIIDSTFINRMFGGKLRTRVTCEHCNTNSDTYENFSDLSLEFSQANSVSAALKSYRRLDRMNGSNQYNCSKCKRLRNAKLVRSVFTPPAVLTLQLMKYSARGSKIHKRIQFEESLDLRPVMGDGARPTRYNLYAVVCHQGQTIHSGHYYSYIKASDGKWYLADDSTVQRVTNTRHILVNPNAYVLFYSRDRADFLSSMIEENCKKDFDSSLQSKMINLHKRKASEDLEIIQKLTAVPLEEFFDCSDKDHDQSFVNGRSKLKKQRGNNTAHNQLHAGQFIGPIMPKSMMAVESFHSSVNHYNASDELHENESGDLIKLAQQVENVSVSTEIADKKQNSKQTNSIASSLHINEDLHEPGDKMDIDARNQTTKLNDNDSTRAQKKKKKKKKKSKHAQDGSHVIQKHDQNEKSEKDLINEFNESRKKNKKKKKKQMIAGFDDEGKIKDKNYKNGGGIDEDHHEEIDLVLRDERSKRSDENFRKKSFTMTIRA